MHDFRIQIIQVYVQLISLAELLARKWIENALTRL